MKAGIRTITEKKQRVFEKHAVKFEDCDFVLEEMVPIAQPKAIEKAGNEVVVLKELKQVKLQLEEETARNAREITKLKEELDEEKKQRLKMENLRLEEEIANNNKGKAYEKEITRLTEELAEGLSFPPPHPSLFSLHTTHTHTHTHTHTISLILARSLTFREESKVESIGHVVGSACQCRR